VLEELLYWAINVWILKKEFAYDIKVLKMPVENLGDIRPYVLLRSICLYVCLCNCSYILFMVLCITALAFRVADPLSPW